MSPKESRHGDLREHGHPSLSPRAEKRETTSQLFSCPRRRYLERGGSSDAITRERNSWRNPQVLPSGGVTGKISLKANKRPDQEEESTTGGVTSGEKDAKKLKKAGPEDHVGRGDQERRKRFEHRRTRRKRKEEGAEIPSVPRLGKTQRGNRSRKKKKLGHGCSLVNGKGEEKG